MFSDSCASVVALVTSHTVVVIPWHKFSAALLVEVNKTQQIGTGNRARKLHTPLRIGLFWRGCIFFLESSASIASSQKRASRLLVELVEQGEHRQVLGARCVNILSAGLRRRLGLRHLLEGCRREQSSHNHQWGLLFIHRSRYSA